MNDRERKHLNDFANQVKKKQEKYWVEDDGIIGLTDEESSETSKIIKESEIRCDSCMNIIGYNQFRLDNFAKYKQSILCTVCRNQSE
jgi:hypothetical protein